MTDPSDDRDLASRFAELRAHDRGRAPDFESLLRPGAVHMAPRRIALRRVAVSGMVLAAASVAGVVLLRHPAPPAFHPVEVATWQSPTASLLQAPGSALLRTPSLTASVVNIDALLHGSANPVKGDTP